MARRTFLASGSVIPSRFVKRDTTADGKGLQCGAGDQVAGVSQKGSRRIPYGGLDDGNCAIAGEPFEYYAEGELAYLELGGTVAAGDRLKSDSVGRGITTTTDQDEYGAIANWAGVSGNLIEVLVQPNSRYS